MKKTKTYKITLELSTCMDESEVRESLGQSFANVEAGRMNSLSIDEQGKESYQNVAHIEAEWSCATLWSMDDILEALNENSEDMTYTASDIRYTWVKWNNLNVETSDGNTVEIEGDFGDTDYKNPIKVIHYDSAFNKLYEE